MSQLWVLESEDGAVTATAAGSLASLGTGELRWSLSREACGAEQLDTILTVCTVSKHSSSLHIVMSSFRGRSSRATATAPACPCQRGGQQSTVRSKDDIPVCRCDQFPNCADFSDEAACQLVVLPDNYVSDYAPFTVDTDTGRMRRIGVKIKVAVTIMLHFRDNVPCRWISFLSWASTK